MNTDLYTIVKEIVEFLSSLKYEVSVFDLMGRYDIRFPLSHFEEMPNRHKNAIRMLTGGFLDEFLYEKHEQHIYLKKKNEGLDPEDGRYNCLLNEIAKVSSNEKPCTEPNREIFVNYVDSFKRVIER